MANQWTNRASLLETIAGLTQLSGTGEVEGGVGGYLELPGHVGLALPIPEPITPAFLMAEDSDVEDDDILDDEDDDDDDDDDDEDDDDDFLEDDDEDDEEFFDDDDDEDLVEDDDEI